MHLNLTQNTGLPHSLSNILTRNPSCLILILLLSNEILSKIAKDPSLSFPFPLTVPQKDHTFCTLFLSWGSSLFESKPSSSMPRFRMAELESKESDLVLQSCVSLPTPCCFPFSQASSFQCWRFRKFLRLPFEPLRMQEKAEFV